MSEKAVVMDEQSINRAISRMAYEIIEKNQGVFNVVIVGIKRRGVPIAKRIAQKINDVEKTNINVGVLDITMFRDDISSLSQKREPCVTDITFPIEGKTVILVDDVLQTGRTARAAIDALIHIGRPSMIQLAVLIDRGHREFPICADYRGKNIPTSKTELVNVYVDEINSKNRVTISEGV